MASRHPIIPIAVAAENRITITVLIVPENDRSSTAIDRTMTRNISGMSFDMSLMDDSANALFSIVCPVRYTFVPG